MLIPHTLDDVSNKLANGAGVPFGSRCQPIGLDRFAFSRSGIADAKKKATTGKPGGDEAASDDRLGTHCHSGIPHQHPHLIGASK